MCWVAAAMMQRSRRLVAVMFCAVSTTLRTVFLAVAVARAVPAPHCDAAHQQTLGGAPAQVFSDHCVCVRRPGI